MKKTYCYCCKGDFIRKWIKKDKYEFYICGDCGYAGLNETLEEKELKLNYNETYYDERYSNQAELTILRESQYALDVEYLNKICNFKELINVLDFGSGTGKFLNRLPGVLKYGVEVNSSAIENGIYRKNNLKVVSNILDLPNELNFNLITMRGVIEHLSDPISILNNLSRKLKDGGYFYICATPDNDSPCAMIFREKWNQFNPPVHIHYFSRRSIVHLAAQAGLQLISYECGYIDTPYANLKNDGKKFISAAKQYPKLPPYCSPAYPGTMMSLIFKKNIS